MIAVKLILNIAYEEDASSFVIIWSSNNQNSGDVVRGDINCISNNEEGDSIPITNLVVNVVYSLCLMDKDSTNVSLLDCISCILIVLSLVMNIVFGIVIGFSKFNYNPFFKQRSLTPKFSIQTMDSVLYKHET